MRAEPSTPRPSDPAAFRGFYREHFGFVWHVVGRFGVAPGEHGDAVQDTFVTAYRRLDAMSGGSPRAWLYGIARRVVSNYRRGAQRIARKHHAARVSMPSVAPQTVEALHTLDRFLDGLDERDRELFVLAEVLGLSGPEIAAAMAIEQRAVYARLRLLRSRLADVVPDGLLAALSCVRADEPSANTRSWLALAPLLGGDVAATGAVASGIAGASATTKLMLAAVAIGIVASVVTVAAAPSDAPAVALAPTVPDREAPPEVIASAAAFPQRVVVAPVTSETKRAPASPSRVVVPRVVAPDDDALADDNAVLDAAIVALDAGDHVRVLALTDAHARRFPQSPLRDVAAALRIDALCAAGKSAQARGEAWSFVAAFPQSPAVERLQRSPCDAKKPDEPDTAGSR